MAKTVTATITANGSNGMVLRVYVLTGAAATQNGASATQSAAAAHNASITTTVTGSRVYGACLNGAATAPTVFSAATTAVDAVADSGHTKDYATCKATSTTGTPGATTLGYTDNNNGGIALYEVLPSGTLAEDSSAPAVVSTTAAQTLTTASFTPPAGSVLVALVAANGASSTVVTASVSDSDSLTWTAQATANASNMKFAGVWTAVVPSAAVSLPPGTRRAVPRGLPPVRRFRPLLVPPALDAPFPFGETAQRRQEWPRGLPRHGRATFTVPPQLNPPYPFAEAAQHRQAWPRGVPRKGRQVTPVPAQVNPPYPVTEVRQQRQPRGFFPRRGRRAEPVPAQQAAPAAPAFVQVPARRARVFPGGRRGRAVQPVPAQQAAPAPVFVPQPQRHARLATALVRRRAPSVVPGQHHPPLGALRRARVLVPRLRGRAAQPVPAQVTVQAPAWVPGHRSPLRAIAFLRRRFAQLLPWPQATVPPFSIGALTASAAPGDTLTAADAADATLTATASAAALTAAVAPSGTAAYAATYSTVYGPAEGVLTAADTRAGGPS